MSFKLVTFPGRFLFYTISYLCYIFLYCNFQPRYNTPDNSPAKKFAENVTKPTKKAVSPARGTSGSSPPKRKSPKLVPVVPLKRVRAEPIKKSGLLTSEKKTELVPPGRRRSPGSNVTGRKGKIVTSSVKKKSKIQTAASNTVKKALKIGRSQLNMRATRATTAAIEAAKLQQEQRKAATASLVGSQKPRSSPNRRLKTEEEIKPVKSSATKAEETKSETKSETKDKTKDKTPHKAHHQTPSKHGGSHSESKSEKHKLSPLRTRSTSKLDAFERDAEKAAKKRHSEGEGSTLPRKLLLIDTAPPDSDRKSPDRRSVRSRSPDRRSVRSRSMSNDSMPPFSPIKSEAPEIIDLDLYESFTDSPSATPTKVKKKKKRDKSKTKGDKSHKKIKKDKDRGEKSPKKRDKLDKHSKEYKRSKKRHKKLKLKAKLRAEREAAAKIASASGSSFGGVVAGSDSSITSTVTSMSPHKHKVKSSKPAGEVPF